MNPQTEFELKCQVPAEQRSGVERAVATARAVRMRLQARYFDTADGRLAAAGLALRLRHEGDHWVQALKGRGDGLLTRLEHECPVPGAKGRPLPELSRHDGTPAGQALREALGAKPTPLQEVFGTDIVRICRRVTVGSAQVESAFDEGVVRAGRRRARVCEVEFELKRGEPAAVFALARKWVTRHGLLVDPATKAERAVALALQGGIPSGGLAVQGAAHPPAAATTEEVSTRLAQRLPDHARQILAVTLRHAAAVASGARPAEHLHDLRVGLRRLRSLLRELAPCVSGLESEQAADLEARLGDLARALGAVRDQEVLRDELLPALWASGIPSRGWVPKGLASSAGSAPGEAGAAKEEKGSSKGRPGPSAHPGVETLRSPLTQALWLDTLAALGTAPREVASASRRVRERARRLQRRVVHQAQSFKALDSPARHTLRKRIKRLRVLLEVQGPEDSLKRHRKQLARCSAVQDALGRLNDLELLAAWLDRRDGPPQQVRRARQWLATQEREAAHAAGRAIKAWLRGVEADHP